MRFVLRARACGRAEGGVEVGARDSPGERQVAPVVVGARTGRHGRRRRAEARRRRRLVDAVDADEGAALDMVRVQGRFARREHRREARIAAFEQRTPLGARATGKDLCQAAAQIGPAAAVVEVGQAFGRHAGRSETFDQSAAELGLDRRDRDVLAVGTSVDVVERRARVEQIGAARAVVQAGGHEPEEGRHQRRRAVDHRRVDDLAATALLRAQQGADDAECEQQRAAGVVAEEIERRRRRRARRGRSRAARRRGRCS